MLRARASKIDVLELALVAAHEALLAQRLPHRTTARTLPSSYFSTLSNDPAKP
jgi:hypothetical protein